MLGASCLRRSTAAAAAAATAAAAAGVGVEPHATSSSIVVMRLGVIVVLARRVNVLVDVIKVASAICRMRWFEPVRVGRQYLASILSR